MQQSLR